MASAIGCSERMSQGAYYLSVDVTGDETVGAISDLSPYSFAPKLGVANYLRHASYSIGEDNAPPGTNIFNEGTNLYVSGSVLSYGVLNEWGNPPSPSAKRPGPTPTAWNPRAASRAFSSAFSPALIYAGAWKIRIFGPVWGVLCQYDSKDYGTGAGVDYDGPTDAVMEDETPASYEVIDCEISEWFEFQANASPGAATVDIPNGLPALAIFWGGYELADFSWYS